MKKDRIYILGAAAFLTVIFALVFLAIEMGSVHLVMAACLSVVIFAAAALTLYIRAIHLRNIKEMTHELIDLTNTLEERDYSHYSADTTVFFQALAAVKQTFIQRDHTRKEMLDVAHYVALNMDFDKTLQELMPKLAELTRSNCCAFYAVNNASRLSIKHSIGFGKNIYSEFDLDLGEGFIGHLAMKEEATVVHDVPDDTIYMVRTFLGKIKPRNIMVVPIFHQEQLNGVLVCASINAYSEEDLSLVGMIRYYLGVAVGNGINSEKTKRLTNELAFQNKLIQNQHEEMRKRLRDKELLLYHLVNMIGDEIVYVLDADYRVLYWNKSAKALYGITREEAVGRHIDQIHGELGCASIKDVLQNLGRCPIDSQTIEHCIWITGRDGKSHRFELRFSQLADEGPLGFVAKVVSRD